MKPQPEDELRKLACLWPKKSASLRFIITTSRLSLGQAEQMPLLTDARMFVRQSCGRRASQHVSPYVELVLSNIRISWIHNNGRQTKSQGHVDFALWCITISSLAIWFTFQPPTSRTVWLWHKNNFSQTSFSQGSNFPITPSLLHYDTIQNLKFILLQSQIAPLCAVQENYHISVKIQQMKRSSRHPDTYLHCISCHMGMMKVCVQRKAWSSSKSSLMEIVLGLPKAVPHSLLWSHL